MCNWQYDFPQLLEEMDTFANTLNDIAFTQTWIYTKKMIAAHAEAMRPKEMSLTEALSLAWSQFESTFDENDDDAILALAGIVIHLVNTVPLGQTRAFHDAIEIGFARARGFSKEDAQQERLAASQASYHQGHEFELPTFHPSNPVLTVIDGGKS